EYAPLAGHGCSGTAGSCCTSQEGLRSTEVAELRHGDASKRESRRVIAQGDPLQCAEGIARREGPRRGRDQRVHRNPFTVVAPTVPIPGAKCIPGPTTIRTYRSKEKRAEEAHD